MATSRVCGICGGAAAFYLPGATGVVSAEAMSPTCHVPGQHGDLYRCRECGTVQQPALPHGLELTDLYREMHDERYLDEEEGRRRSANRLLDLIAEHRPPSPNVRLLDVGCAHGLLLHEAHRRGYATLGLELSAASARYGREVLGLDVREQTLEDLAASDEGCEPFDVIVLADVIEHLDDPCAILDQLAALLTPGGVLCVVTPDPASKTARIARGRWWGFIPAHTYLLPRRTLRELLSARGLVVSTDVPLVRDFTLRYWMAGFAERSGAVAAAVRRIARTKPAGAMVSLSLGDERIMLAHRVEVLRTERPLSRPRGGEQQVLVVLPAYNAAKTIPRVADELPADAADGALVVDDCSRDATTAIALEHGFDVLRHPVNRGYGANQKSCYVQAAREGYDAVVMVHADNQYDPALVPQIVAPILAGRADVVIGSRLLEDRAIQGGMPRWKWVGNRFLTTLENLAFRRSYSEYHTGYRAFSVDFLRSIAFLRNNDEFVFDQEIFAQAVARGARVEEVAIPTRYFLEASSVSFGDSVEYGLRTLYVLARFRMSELGRPWAPLGAPATRLDADPEPVLDR
jgi:SAM-dependent methyltransferase